MASSRHCHYSVSAPHAFENYENGVSERLYSNVPVIYEKYLGIYIRAEEG